MGAGKTTHVGGLTKPLDPWGFLPVLGSPGAVARVSRTLERPTIALNNWLPSLGFRLLPPPLGLRTPPGNSSCACLDPLSPGLDACPGLILWAAPLRAVNEISVTRSEAGAN